MRLPFTALIMATCIILLAFSMVRGEPAPKEQKRFVPFDAARVESGSIINVPVQCPPERIKIGNRCRALF